MAKRGLGNARVIGQLLAELDALGVTEYCVAAGARNAPLLAVMLQRAEAGGLTMRHFYEERCAAFFALGRCMALRQPVAVVTTSGTAVAELLPAVMEAYYQALPLVVVTADRPSSYRGSGAPQAVEQPGIFGPYAVRTVELEETSDGVLHHQDDSPARTGPVHFNVCLEEDLAVQVPECHPLMPPPSIAHREEACNALAWEEFWSAKGAVVVLAAGLPPGDVPEAVEFLKRLKAPVVAEATSNLHGQPELAPWLIPASERALQRLDAARVLRLGAVPSWRWWRDLEDRDEVKVLNVSRAAFPGLARRSGVSSVAWTSMRLLPVPGVREVASFPALSDVGPFLVRHPRSEPAWMRHLSRKIGAGSTLFLGNSLPIREWNLAADPLATGVEVHASRGANGIDGLVSTWLGLAAEVAESWLVIGDLSTLYDLSAPWILAQLRPARRRMVIINNGGGKIFSRVAWLKEAGPEARKVMENAHQLSFEPWARFWGMRYRLLTDPAELESAAPDWPEDGTGEVWEVRPAEEETVAFWQEWQTA